MTIVPQSMRLGDVPVAGINQGNHSRNPTRRFTSKASMTLILVLSSIMLGTFSIYENSSEFAKIAQQPFSYLMPSHPSMTRMLSDEATQNALRNEQPIGKPHSTTFLLGIFSMDSDKEKGRRELIRQTMLASQKEDSRICSLKEYLDYSKRTGLQTQDCISPYAFIVAAGGEGRPTVHGDNDEEPIVLDPSTIPNAEEDCIYLNIRENMEDGKSITYFKYGQSIATQFGIDYIGKADSDSLINMRLFLNFLMNDLAPSPYNRRIYGGQTWTNTELSSIYATGQFYFMSADLAKYVSVTMSHERREELTSERPTEDMDVGAFVFSHPRPIKFISLSSYTFWAHPIKSVKEWTEGYEEGMTENPLRGSVMPIHAVCFYHNLAKNNRTNDCLDTCFEESGMVESE